MLRAIVCASLALLLCAGMGWTAEKGKGAKGKAKGSQARGKVQKVDTAKGTLTIAAKKKQQEATEKEISLTDQTKIVTFDSDQKKTEVVGKTGLSSIQVGDRVAVQLDDKGAARQITVNPPRRKQKPKQ